MAYTVSRSSGSPALCMRPDFSENMQRRRQDVSDRKDYPDDFWHSGTMAIFMDDLLPVALVRRHRRALESESAPPR